MGLCPAYPEVHRSGRTIIAVSGRFAWRVRALARRTAPPPRWILAVEANPHSALPSVPRLACDGAESERPAHVAGYFRNAATEIERLNRNVIILAVENLMARAYCVCRIDDCARTLGVGFRAEE